LNDATHYSYAAAAAAGEEWRLHTATDAPLQGVQFRSS